MLAAVHYWQRSRDFLGLGWILLYFGQCAFYGCCASQSRDDKCLTLLVSRRANFLNPEICIWT
jgi:hypothetical protein